MDIADIIVRGGTAGALVVVVWLFLKEMRAVRSSFLETIQNHLEHNTAALGKVKSAVDRLVGYLDGSGRS